MAIAKSVAPHGLVTVLARRREFARQYPQVRNTAANRELLERGHVGLLPRNLPGEAVVVDVGANVGDWAAAARLVLPEARIIAIEPQPALAAQLRNRFRDDEKVTTKELALAASPATVVLHLMQNSHMASVRMPTAGIVDAYDAPEWFTVVDSLSVQATTLDGLLCDVEEVSVLKIDAQGSEREVLRGATSTLEKTCCILIEVTFVSFYEGDASFAELDELLRSCGFAVSGLNTPGRLADGRLAAADACYVGRRMRGPQVPRL